LVYLRHYLAQCSPLILAILCSHSLSLSLVASLATPVYSLVLAGRHHPLCMYLATIAAGRHHLSQHTSRRRSSSLASRLISRTMPVYLANRRCRHLLSSRMYTNVVTLSRYHVLYSCSICLLGKMGGSFFLKKGGV
jgi:hypothetical protein